MADLPIDDARDLVQAMVELVRMADRALPRQASPLARRVRDHLGDVGDVVPNISATLAPHEHVNLQLALDAHQRAVGSGDAIGLATDVGNWSGVSLGSLLGGSWHGPGEVARQYTSIDIGGGQTVACLRSGIVLTMHAGHQIAVLHYAIERYRPELVVEVAAPTQAVAEAFLAHLRGLMNEHNAYRGKVLSFGFGHLGEFGLHFASVPTVERDQVILAAGHLEAIDAHAIDITNRRHELLAGGHHLRRGLLLYGPPGTGKTHTVSYLIGRMTGRTTFLLAGPSVGAIGQAAQLARQLQPATIVIEDVDLIAMDRELPGSEHGPLLFQLLNEMDGLGDDADVLFVLTTNRVAILEDALAARPGRVDQAIELPLPDDEARRRLLALYARQPIDDRVVAEVVRRTAGAAASFIKELARRAALAALRNGTSAEHELASSLDAMLDQSAPVLRRSLAAPAGDDPLDMPTHE